jgi:DNA-binding CsgD family transcriptional regulator
MRIPPLGDGCAQIQDSPLTEDDVRAMIRLLAAVIAAPCGIADKRRLLMNGLCGLIHASSWAWCMAEFDPEKPPSFIGFEHGGWDEERFARFIAAMNHPDMEPVTRPSSIELQEKGTHLTRTQRQMDPDMLLEKSNAAAFWKNAGIGAIMISQRPMDGGGVSGIGVYRNLGQPHFDERDARVAHIILSEVPWLHFQAFPDPQSLEITRLYPRHRTVLNLLCEGWGRKKIAAHLGLSVNTVHGYAKIIFNHFQVHSQSELIARLTKGDGGDL